MTAYQRHQEAWKSCERCPLCVRRKRVVLCRGKLPCNVLFVGEAPGVSEDVLGRPFVGPAGKLLDSIVERALDGQHDYAMTNLVACIPLGGKTDEPPEESIKACRPRLQELVQMALPKLVVRIGKLAAKHFKGDDQDGSFVDITHPAAILRMDASQQGLALQRSIAAIESALEGIE